MSTIPNYHHWLCHPSHGIKRNEYFQPHGKSPRNLILQALNVECDEAVDIDQIMQYIFEERFHTSTSTIPKRKKKKMKKKAQNNAASDHTYCYPNVPSTEGTFLNKIRLARTMNSKRLLQLPCTENNTQKYSIVANMNNCEFVHVFATTTDNFIACQSGLCQHQHGKKLKYKRLNESASLCIHLLVCKEYGKEIYDSLQSNCFEQDGYSSDKSDYESDQQYEDDLDNNDDPTNQPQLGLHESQWEEVFDPAAGAWCFKSDYGYLVEEEADSVKLSTNATKRKEFLGNSFNDVEKYYPFVKEKNCNCQIS